MKDNRDPRQVLRSIEERLIEMQNDSDFADIEPRIKPKPGELTYDVLKYIHENQPVHSKDITANTNCGKSRILSRLHQGYLVDREQDGTGYVYVVSELGEKAFDEQQSELDESQGFDPWVGTPLNRSQYIALKVVENYDGHPKTSDVEDDFLSHGFESNTDSIAISSRLSDLIDTPYIDRTPEDPYRYWVTEEGKELLDE